VDRIDLLRPENNRQNMMITDKAFFMVLVNYAPFFTTWYDVFEAMIALDAQLLFFH
jgi:hypothetical protein